MKRIKRIKKRWTSDAQICAAIDECKDNAAKFMKNYESLRAEAASAYLRTQQWKGDKLRRLANQAFKRAACQSYKLDKLKVKMAEFRTVPMPFIPDASIPQ